MGKSFPNAWRFPAARRCCSSRLVVILGSILALAPLAPGQPKPPAAPSRTHLFIAAGEAHAMALDMPGRFTRAIKAAFPGDQILVVQGGEEEAPIVRWDRSWRMSTRKTVDPAKRGDLYDAIEDSLNTVMDGHTIDTATLIWLQGETDAKLGLAATYEKALKAVISRFRDDLERDDLHVIIGRINDHGHSLSFSKSWSLVRLTQVDVAEMDPHGDWINTDDLNGAENSLHYTRAGVRVLESRIAARAIKLIATTPRKP